MRNVSLLVAIAVNDAGHREILGICEGAKEDLAGWKSCNRGKTQGGLGGWGVSPFCHTRLKNELCFGLALSLPDGAVIRWRHARTPTRC